MLGRQNVLRQRSGRNEYKPKPLLQGVKGSRLRRAEMMQEGGLSRRERGIERLDTESVFYSCNGSIVVRALEDGVQCEAKIFT